MTDNQKPLPDVWEREICGISPSGYAMCKVYKVIGNPPEFFLCFHESCGYFWARPAMGHVQKIEANDYKLIEAIEGKPSHPLPEDRARALEYVDTMIAMITSRAPKDTKSIIIASTRVWGERIRACLTAPEVNGELLEALKKVKSFKLNHIMHGIIDEAIARAEAVGEGVSLKIGDKVTFSRGVGLQDGVVEEVSGILYINPHKAEDDGVNYEQ